MIPQLSTTEVGGASEFPRGASVLIFGHFSVFRNYCDVFPDRFMPAPIRYANGPEGRGPEPANPNQLDGCFLGYPRRNALRNLDPSPFICRNSRTKKEDAISAPSSVLAA